MSISAYFVIILCLAVNTDTRSVEGTESETVSGERNRLQGGVVHEAIAGNSSRATANPDKCTENSECPDGKTCENSLCVCREGLSGDNCEVVHDDLCKALIEGCSESGGSCMYDEKGDKLCNCKEKVWDMEQTKCLDISSLFTTTTAATTETTLTANSTRITEGHTRDLFTSISTESSSVSEMKNDSITTIKPDDTTVSTMQFSTPNSTTEESSKGHPLNITSEIGSTTPTTIHTGSTGTDLCATNPCRNGGICRMEGNTARCYCIEPFSGHICEKDPCSSNPCENGGMCKINGTAFRCECSSPYSGKFCEKDPCSENPCQNGGTCFFNGNSFKCLCKQPFAGIMCDTDPCVWNPCKNGGICKIENEAAKCFCKEPFTGEFCDSRSNPCNWNPCKNGGDCKIENGIVKCYCKKPFTGEFCESSSEIDVYLMIFAAVSIFLIGVLIFVSCILRQRYHALKTN